MKNMVKVNKNTKKKLAPVMPEHAESQIESDAESSEGEDQFDEIETYDSMIENGTSEDSNEEESSAEEENVNVTKKAKVNGNTAVSKAAKRKVNDSDSQNTSPKTATLPKKKPKQSSNTEKVKPPTLEEINELKETRNLFHSNLFRLQVKEMLTELEIKQKYTNYINQWLEDFKLFLKKLSSQSEKCDMDKMLWLRQTQIQVPLSLQDLHIKKQKIFQFQFIKPTAPPYLIGAAASQTLLGPKLIADVCVSMPAECFQKENYLNLVYDQKRAYYLTYLSDQLLRKKHFPGLTVEHFQFSYYRNNPLKPVLEITPPNESVAQKLRIRVFVSAEESSFKLSRFVPWNSNIRSSLFDEEDETSVPLATPAYNANVLFDLTMQRNAELLQKVIGDNKNFKDGVLLLKVWLQQRQLDVGFSGFNAHMLSMFVAYLLNQRKLYAKMSSYQVARTVWNQLAFSTWDETSKGISLCPADKVVASQPTLEQFHANYEVVFVDVTGYHNICANLSLEMYRRARLEAKLAVDMLNDMKLNSFQQIFMTKCPLYMQFDHILKISKTTAVEQILDLHVPAADRYNYAGYAYPQLLKVVTSLLRKGLGARVHTLVPLEETTSAWDCTVNAPPCAQHLSLGIVLDAAHAYEVLDKGPESFANEAADFRKFWGDKAQLRRFQDGTITESVVWAASTDTLAKKRLIVRSIVLHLLQRHFQLEADDVYYMAGELDMAYKLTSAFKLDKFHGKFEVSPDTDAESQSLAVIHAFDELSRQLYTLGDLPLDITGIAGISPVFRYCEPQPLIPNSRPIKGHLHAMHTQYAVMQLGASGKWPSELGAFRALKTAFYIQIAQLLREKHMLKTRVSYDGVLVLKHGHCFSIEIAHPKELALLKRAQTDRGITQYSDSPASIAMEKRHYILPKVTGALHALYQVQSSFGGTVMIAKRWLYSQLLDDGLWPDECTELLIASQYLKLQPELVTCSPQTGFLRFLQLLANTDWQTELFVLNFNNSMDENELADLEQRFNTTRDAFPPLCIATAYDEQHYGQLWTTAEQPSVHVLARVTLLARQALVMISEALQSPDSGFIRASQLFTASSEGYDLVIQLKPDLVPNAFAYEFGSPFTAFSKPNWLLPLAGQNFMKESVQKLRSAYSEFAAFFYNPFGGKEIAVIWKPNVFAAKEFKVTDVNGCALQGSGNRVQCQKEALIEDFKFILKDFYLRIGTVQAIAEASKNPKTNETKGKKANRYFSEKKLKNVVDKVAVQTKNKNKVKKSKQWTTTDRKTISKVKKTKNIAIKQKVAKPLNAKPSINGKKKKSKI